MLNFLQSIYIYVYRLSLRRYIFIKKTYKLDSKRDVFFNIIYVFVCKMSTKNMY